LFIGTFPTAAKNRAFEFFYPNRSRSAFWKILSSVAGVDLDLQNTGEAAVTVRKKILDCLKAGVTDMGLEVIRAGESSRDEHLKVLKYVNVLGLLEDHPNINTIILTSSSGPENAARWFKLYLKQEGIVFQIPKGRKPQQTSLMIKGRIVRVAIVLSPSSRCVNRYSLSYLVEMYQHFLLA
jgi:G:T/U-mismatch repair DNA glycosylase